MWQVKADDLVLVSGMRETRGALERWNDNPWPVLRVWAGGALAVASALLFAVWVIAAYSPVDLTRLHIAGLTEDPEFDDIGHLLVAQLARPRAARVRLRGRLHRRQLARARRRDKSGFSKFVHEKARPIAFAWVSLVTCFSLMTQAYALGPDRRAARRVSSRSPRGCWC